MNCNSISKGWWNVQSAEVLWDALARRICPWRLCQLLKRDSNQLAGYRSGNVMRNKRENRAIKGKSEMITICFRNIIPVKKRIFILFSLAGSVLWGGAGPRNLWISEGSILPWFNLLNRNVLIWLNHLRRSLLQGTFFGKPKGEEGCCILCTSQKCNSYFQQTLIWHQSCETGKAQINPALQCNFSHIGTGPQEQLDTFLSHTCAFGKHIGCSRVGLLTA